MSRSRQPRILVVDDNPDVRAAMCRFLRQEGCVVEAAADGAEGLDRLGRASFDAVVSDIQMPLMDGAEFWRRVIALRPALRDRFVFCSGLPLPASIPREHATRFVHKPFLPQELWRALADVLGEAVPHASGGAG